MARLLLVAAFALSVAFFPGATAERSSTDSGTEREELAAGGADLASNNAPWVLSWRFGNRLSKNKSLGKGLRASHAATEISSFNSGKQASRLPFASKLDLYERLKVYRI
jgi:hypothetical protein